MPDFNLDILKEKQDLSFSPTVKCLHFTKCVASHCQSRTLRCPLEFSKDVASKVQKTTGQPMAPFYCLNDVMI